MKLVLKRVSTLRRFLLRAVPEVFLRIAFLIKRGKHMGCSGSSRDGSSGGHNSRNEYGSCSYSYRYSLFPSPLLCNCRHLHFLFFDREPLHVFCETKL
nr:hypothetical protein Iba_chr01dCG8290 [Ipomoea batatas]